MSNIGFIENCAEQIQKLFREAIEPQVSSDGKRKRCKSISQTDQDEYVFLLRQIEIMREHDEIEDLKRFEIAYRKILECNLLKVKEIKKKLAKQA